MGTSLLFSVRYIRQKVMFSDQRTVWCAAWLSGKCRHCTDSQKVNCWWHKNHCVNKKYNNSRKNKTLDVHKMDRLETDCEENCTYFSFCEGLLPDSANGKKLKLKSVLGTWNSNTAAVILIIKNDKIIRYVCQQFFFSESILDWETNKSKFCY